MENLQSELENTSAELLRVISGFTQEDFYLKPEEGSWSAGEVLEHLRLANGGVVKLLYGTTQPTHRQPDELVEKFKFHFLDFTIAMKSPDFVFPANKNYNKQELLQTSNQIMQNLRKAAEELDLSDTIVDFAFPVYGELTRLELICFANYHTQRHTRQLKNIYTKLTTFTQQVRY